MRVYIVRVYPMFFEPLPVKRRMFTGIFDRIVYALFYKRIYLTIKNLPIKNT